MESDRQPRWRTGAAAIAVSLFVVVALAACHGARDQDPMSQSSRGDTLRLELEVPTTVPLGKAVPMVLRVRNLTDRVLTLYLQGIEVTFDLQVARPDGTVIWTRLAGETVPAILRVETLGPAGSLTLEGAWDQRTTAGAAAEPGSYRAEGILPTEEGLLRTPASSFRISGPASRTP